MVSERLQRALERGWVAREAVGEARKVVKDLENRKQRSMEEAFGTAAGAAVVQSS
jgi:hypothetical protein